MIEKYQNYIDGLIAPFITIGSYIMIIGLMEQRYYTMVIQQFDIQLMLLTKIQQKS